MAPRPSQTLDPSLEHQHDAELRARTAGATTRHEIETAYTPVSLMEWVAQNHPQYYAALQSEGQQQAATANAAGGQFSASDFVTNAITKGRYGAQLQSEYNSYRHDRGVQMGQQIAEATKAGKLSKNYEPPAGGTIDHKAVDAGAASAASAPGGPTTNATSATGGPNFNVTGTSSGTYPIDPGNLSTILQASLGDAGSLLTKASQASVYGDQGVADMGGGAPQPENLINVDMGPMTGQQRSSAAIANEGGSLAASMGAQHMNTDEQQMTLGNAITFLSRLDRGELVNLQQHLAAAGYYDPTKVAQNQILWGIATDPDTIKAWQSVLLQHLQDPTKNVADVIRERESAYAPTLSDILSGKNASSGAAISVNLTDPAAVQKFAEDFYRQNIGRDPTPGEVQQMVSSIHGAQVSIGDQKKAVLRTKLGAVPIATQALVGASTGNDVRVPGHSIDDWARDLLKTMGKPVTDVNVRAMTTWAAHESGGYKPSYSGGKNNPLNTTEGARGFESQGGAQGNIKNFADYAQGIDAQAYNLMHTQGAGYEAILAALDAQDPQRMFQAINNSSFGTHFPSNVPLQGSSDIGAVLSGQGAGTTQADPTMFGPSTVPESQRVFNAEQAVNTIQEVDPAAQVAEWAKLHDPTEYGAQQLGNEYNNLIGLLGGKAVSGQ